MAGEPGGLVIRHKLYVDKNCNPCGLGAFGEPYQKFAEAVAAAGNGSEIIFLSSGTHDEVTSSILMEKRIKVSLNAGVETPVVIE